MNQIATTKQTSTAVAMTDTDLIRVLGESLYPGAKPENIMLVLSYCRAAGLDPMLKPVHIVPMWDSNARKMRDVIMPGIGHYRVQASRSGSYAGKTEPEFGPDQTKTFTNKLVTFPEWCKVTVRRVVGNVVAEFTAKERWIENYATEGRDTSNPNAMWTKRPYGQLAKVAEAQALRMAFPELLGAETAEEMEGKTLDAEPRLVNPEPKPAPEKGGKAKAQLDSFANVKPKDDTKVDEKTGEVLDGEIVTDLPKMPPKAAEALAKGKWGAGWNWFAPTIKTVPPSQRAEFWAAHAAMLEKARAFNEEAKAAVEALAKENGIKLNDNDKAGAGN